jgi:hypothetical protein
LVVVRIDQGAIEMSLNHLSALYLTGSMLNGPARPRSPREQAEIRAAVRRHRLARVRGT